MSDNGIEVFSNKDNVMLEKCEQEISSCSDNRTSDIRKDIAEVLNRHRRGDRSNTPDLILADYLVGCLGVFDNAMTRRLDWHGSDLK